MPENIVAATAVDVPVIFMLQNIGNAPIFVSRRYIRAVDVPATSVLEVVTRVAVEDMAFMYEGDPSADPRL